MRTLKFIELQLDAIEKYGVTIEENSACWRRMHAHVKERKICKWHPKNSIEATYDLFHEIGHIMTTKPSMRRCESEFFASQWAIDELKNEYGITVPASVVQTYQRYINMELDRGLRRGGKYYPATLQLRA